MDWCHDTLPGDHRTAFKLLKEQEIGIDMLDSIALFDPTVFSSQTKVPFGTAGRILKHHQEWLSTLTAITVHSSSIKPH